MIAAAGGVGGGGILVPIYSTAWHFPTKLAIPLSNITILGGALANFLLNVTRRHPEPNIHRPLIDFDLVLMMEPTTMLGSMLGAMLNKLLPAWLLSIALVVLLSVTSYRTYCKWRFLQLQEAMLGHQWETQRLVAYRRSSSLPLIMYDSPKDSDSFIEEHRREDEAERQSYGTYYPHPNLRTQMELADLLQEEGAVVPWKKLLYLVLIEMVVVVFILARGVPGGGFNPLGMTCGSDVYFALVLAPMLWLAVNFVFIRYHLLREYRRKLRIEYPFAEGDVRWNATSTLKYPLICTLAGVFAGMFGIGGGIIKGPLMLEMGVLPEVAAATSAFMILFTTSSAMVVYLAFGQVVLRFAGFVFIMGFGCTWIGHVVVTHITAQAKKSSIIVLLIFIIIALSTVLMGMQSLHAVLHPIAHPPSSSTRTFIDRWCAMPSA